ncbi:MAG: adenine phosphoribosyltransferase [Candidatus Omnitrophica bacterium]|nr:adenine phosphoribosyltransferase [Candidatus Omnitrophota bacterium]MCB9720787.1 adenine phosphoribosyltransferase [Candidatus Omnitrophota bacterium]
MTADKKAVKETELKEHIRDIRDFPKEGIVFKDITTLLKDRQAFRKSVDLLADKFRDTGIDQVVGVEARGFIFGAALAYALGVGFVPVRKKGKLPGKTRSVTYTLEYGEDSLEIHEDAITPGTRVLIVDDLLATGGTIEATSKLIAAQKAEVAGIAFLIELRELKGKDKLKDFEVYSVLKY